MLKKTALPEILMQQPIEKKTCFEELKKLIFFKTIPHPLKKRVTTEKNSSFGLISREAYTGWCIQSHTGEKTTMVRVQAAPPCYIWV